MALARLVLFFALLGRPLADDALTVASFEARNIELGVVSSSRRRGSNTVISRTSATDEVGSSFKDLLIGILLVVVAFPCLYYNEKRQVHMDKIFDYADSHIVDVSADAVDETNHACPVCVQGETSTEETLKDQKLNVEVSGCVKLNRSAEMYQWVETSRSESEDTNDGGKTTKTTYTYSQEWRASPVDSANFNDKQYQNPVMPITGDSWTAKDVSLGAYKLDASLIGQMVKMEPADVEDQDIDGKALAKAGPGVIQSGIAGPQIGDLKITMTKVCCGSASVASIQSGVEPGASFQPLTFALVPSGGCCSGPPRKVDLSTAQLNPTGGDVEVNGLCSCIGALIESGESIHNLQEEKVGGKSIIARMRKTQQNMHFLLKALGWVMFMIGFYFIFKFPPAIFRYIPFIGTWIESFGKLLAFIAAFFLGSMCWCITIAVSWLSVKPVRGILLLTAAACCLIIPSFLPVQQ